MRSVLRTLMLLAAGCAFAAPAAAQEFIYRDIQWGSDPRTTTRQLAAEGFQLDEEFVPDEGELMYTDPEHDAVLAFASFAGDQLVGLRIVYSGDNVDELFDQSVQEWVQTIGEPDEADDGVASWHRAGTTFSLFLDETQNGLRYLAAQYAGPGYDEEIARRVALREQPLELPALDPRWVVVLERPEVRTSFDGATAQPLGSRVFRVWLRHDYTQLEADPVPHEMELHQIDYDCGARRFRVGASTYQREGRLVHSETPSEPSNWVAIPPESVGEQILTAVCAVAERR